METRGLTGVVGVGTDLVDIERIRRALARRPGLVHRLFTSDEQAYCDSARSSIGRARRYAARFAVKEAAMKALGVGLGGVAFIEIETIRTTTGQPDLRVTGDAARRADTLGGDRWLVSLTHADHLAHAVVVLTG